LKTYFVGILFEPVRHPDGFVTNHTICGHVQAEDTVEALRIALRKAQAPGMPSVKFDKIEVRESGGAS
jgi:hypothetical protein